MESQIENQVVLDEESLKDNVPDFNQKTVEIVIDEPAVNPLYIAIPAILVLGYIFYATMKSK